MTAGITLAFGGLSIDFNTASGKTGGTMVTYMMINPITPIALQKSTSGGTANTVGINIGFLQESFYVTFTFGDGPGTFNFTATASTNFEKLVYMSYQRGTGLSLNLNGTTFTGWITQLNVPWVSGQKDLAIGGTFTFVYTQTISMGS
jgi:hypothetical protein